MKCYSCKEITAMTDITAPIFIDANAARDHLESLYWPNGPVCCHCGNADAKRITKLAGKSTRPGVRWCNECEKPFSVTVGTVMEDSKIPLNKWVLAFHLMASSKKGMSAHQLHRMLGVTYKTAWFLCHRIREAMDDPEPNKSGGPLGGKGKIVEADETVVGGKFKNRAYRETAPKKAVFTLVERDGRARSFHVANINAKNLRPIVMTNTSRNNTFMTDEAAYYTKMGREFSAHHTVDHSRGEYAYNFTERQSQATPPKTISASRSAALSALIIQSARRI
jgi:transposase-like protein